MKSPEKYEMRLNDLENQQTSKLKEREMKEETFKDKKRLMEQLQSSLSSICKQSGKLDEVQDINEKLKYYNHLSSAYLIWSETLPRRNLCVLFLER